MHNIPETLLAEHQHLHQLVALLERQTSLRLDPAAPNIGWLMDSLFYLTRFPNVAHYALEHRSAERLLARHALDPDLCKDIEEQHARGCSCVGATGQQRTMRPGERDQAKDHC
jgi:hypothetical protein